MSISGFFEGIEVFAAASILILIVIALVSAVYRDSSRKKVNLSDLRSAWPKDHLVHMELHAWDVWRVVTKKGFRSWFSPSFLAFDSKGHSQGEANFEGRTYKEFIDSNGIAITCQKGSKYLPDPYSEYVKNGEVIAKSNANFAMLRDRLQLSYQGHNIIMREVSRGVLHEGWTFFENEILVAESKKLSSFTGSPLVFCFRRSIDESLRNIMCLLSIT